MDNYCWKEQGNIVNQMVGPRSLEEQTQESLRKLKMFIPEAGALMQ